MFRLLSLSLIGFFLLALAVPMKTSAADFISRRDGFLLIWNSTSRPSDSVREAPYKDVQKGDPGFLEITYAKARGFLNDTVENFRPDEPITATDALLLVFRTRSVERLKDDGSTDFMKLPDAPDVTLLAEKYGIEYDSEGRTITRDQVLLMMRDLDLKLQSEQHEVSLYSEKFHGKGTGFGETFDMYAMTAAHRTFPHNTLVKVTNIANGKSVTVRINDRGPFVQGRNMDLSLGAFTTIAARSSGKINATFERLGDVNIVQQCSDTRYQRRITKDVRLAPGIPHSFALGKTLSLISDQPFVLRNLTYPDGTETTVQTWITKEETYQFTPSVTGMYRFLMGTKAGRQREMMMNVVACN